jgi:hypothetical protein
MCRLSNGPARWRARDANLCGSGPYFPPVSSRSAKRAVDYELVPVDIFGWCLSLKFTPAVRAGAFYAGHYTLAGCARRALHRLCLRWLQGRLSTNVGRSIPWGPTR